MQKKIEESGNRCKTCVRRTVNKSGVCTGCLNGIPPRKPGPKPVAKYKNKEDVEYKEPYQWRYKYSAEVVKQVHEYYTSMMPGVKELISVCYRTTAEKFGLTVKQVQYILYNVNENDREVMEKSGKLKKGFKNTDDYV